MKKIRQKKTNEYDHAYACGIQKKKAEFIETVEWWMPGAGAKENGKTLVGIHKLPIIR